MPKQPFSLLWGVHSGGYSTLHASYCAGPDGPKNLCPQTFLDAPMPVHSLKISEFLNEEGQNEFLTHGWPMDQRFRQMPVKRYYPFNETGLFRKFAHLDPSASKITNFANKYGMLGIGVDIVVEDPFKPNSIAISYGEPLNLWASEIHEMRVAWDFWFNGREDNLGWLSDHIRWVSAEEIDYKWDMGSGFLAERHISRFHELFRLDELGMPALYIARRFINDSLERFSLVPTLEFSGTTDRDSERRRFEMGFGVTSLLFALWLQFANATCEKDLEFRSCEHCGGVIQISLEGRRKTRRYCSNACRQAIYRRKRRMKAKLGKPEE